MCSIFDIWKFDECVKPRRHSYSVFSYLPSSDSFPTLHLHPSIAHHFDIELFLPYQPWPVWGFRFHSENRKNSHRNDAKKINLNFCLLDAVRSNHLFAPLIVQPGIVRLLKRPSHPGNLCEHPETNGIFKNSQKLQCYRILTSKRSNFSLTLSQSSLLSCSSARIAFNMAEYWLIPGWLFPELRWTKMNVSFTIQYKTHISNKPTQLEYCR